MKYLDKISFLRRHPLCTFAYLPWQISASKKSIIPSPFLWDRFSLSGKRSSSGFWLSFFMIVGVARRCAPLRRLFSGYPGGYTKKFASPRSELEMEIEVMPWRSSLYYSYWLRIRTNERIDHNLSNQIRMSRKAKASDQDWGDRPGTSE